MNRRNGIVWAAGVVVVGALAVLLALFQPWQLFTTTEVHDALPAAAATASPSPSPFETSDASATPSPAPAIWLSDRRADAASDASSGRWLDLGPLRGNRGELNYSVPAATDLSGYRSVVIWCRRFSVAFGAAPVTG